MLRFTGLYGINAVSFLTNVGAIFIYSALAGPAGYGTYGIYVALMSVFLIVEMSLLKTSLAVAERARRNLSEIDARASAGGFLRLALIPILIGSAALIAVGNLIFPPDAVIKMGGTQIALIVFVEHLLSYPANRLSFYLARSSRFNAVYSWRLFGTLLRHGFAWTVLLLTGSIEMAITAIVLKGLVLGALSLLWIHRHFARTEVVVARPPWAAFTMFAAFTSTAFALLAIQEIPSIFIARTFSREVLGSYRFLYDLTAAVWFVATIYPTVLFSYLLPKHGMLDPSSTRRRIAPLSDALLVFHLTYYLAVSTLLAAMDTLNVDLFLTQMPFAFALTAAVSLLGYSRFQIEAVQALGKARAALVCVAVSAALVAMFFWLVPGTADEQVIGLGWLLGQLVLAVLLRLVLASATQDFPTAARDIAVMAFGFTSVSIAGAILSPDDLVWLGIPLALTSSIAGVALFVRLYIIMRKDVAPVKAALR